MRQFCAPDCGHDPDESADLRDRWEESERRKQAEAHLLTAKGRIETILANFKQFTDDPEKLESAIATIVPHDALADAATKPNSPSPDSSAAPVAGDGQVVVDRGDLERVLSAFYEPGNAGVTGDAAARLSADLASTEEGGTDE